MIANTCPAHLYKHEVAKCLAAHGITGAFSFSLVRRYADMAAKYWEFGHKPDECAFDIHHEWKNEKVTYVEPDYLSPKVCLGVHNFK